jgi:hypothetical protein
MTVQTIQYRPDERSRDLASCYYSRVYTRADYLGRFMMAERANANTPPFLTTAERGESYALGRVGSRCGGCLLAIRLRRIARD